jgi:16S rRNA G966 N2-methylase RsmD
VLLVEADARAVRVARANVAALGVADRVRVSPTTVARALAVAPDEPYDLIFADPPYDLPAADITDMLAGLADNGWLAEEAVVVVERSSRDSAVEWVRGITGERGRRYGETTLWYGRRS